MLKRSEDLITAYKYWSNWYVLSSHVNDLQQKHTIFKQLIEQANNQDISKDDLEKLLAR